MHATAPVPKSFANHRHVPLLRGGLIEGGWRLYLYLYCSGHACTCHDLPWTCCQRTAQPPPGTEVLLLPVIRLGQLLRCVTSNLLSRCAVHRQLLVRVGNSNSTGRRHYQFVALRRSEGQSSLCAWEIHSPAGCMPAWVVWVHLSSLAHHTTSHCQWPPAMASAWGTVGCIASVGSAHVPLSV